MTSAIANGLSIDFESHGPDDGEPILLIMGLGAQLILWSQVFIDRLTEAGLRVIRFDNRDVGRSSRIDAPSPTVKDLVASLLAPGRAKAPYALSDMADDAAGLLDHLGLDRAHVVGVSMGGMIAQELAIGHPSKVASLTSIMSNTGARRTGRMSPKLLPSFIRSRSSLSSTADDAVAMGRLIGGPYFNEQLARDLYDIARSREGDPAAARAGMARQTMAVLATRDRTADLRRVCVPTLVVHGLLDPLVRPSGGMATAAAVPGSRLVIYPDMAHDVPDIRLEELAGEIIRNCRRASGMVPALA